MLSFNAAANELEYLVKSQRAQRARRAESVGEMSDDKDYGDQDLIPREERALHAEGRRRRDLRERFGPGWAGIQAMDDELSDENFDDEEGDEEHEMLVSGRPSRIHFPGARGDSRLSPVSYVTDEDSVDDEYGDPEGRAQIGGDRLSRRSVRRGMDSDPYVRGKSMRRTLSPFALMKSARAFDLVKSKLQDAVMDGNLNPDIAVLFEAVDSRLGPDSALLNLTRALSAVPVSVRRKYGIPSLPDNVFEAQRRNAA